MIDHSYSTMWYWKMLGLGNSTPTALPSGTDGLVSQTFWSKKKEGFKLFLMLLWLFSEQFLLGCSTDFPAGGPMSRDWRLPRAEWFMWKGVTWMVCVKSHQHYCRGSGLPSRISQGNQCFLIASVSGFKVMAYKCNNRTTILIWCWWKSDQNVLLLTEK